MTRSILVWSASVPLYLVMAMLAWVLAPALALLSFATGPVLPWPLCLLHTPDQLGKGLDAGQTDNGWPKPKTVLGLWCQRTYWVLRNPAWGFAAEMLGYPPSRILSESGDPDGPWDRGTGFYKATLEAPDGRRFFTYRRDFRMPGRRWGKLWIGWTPHLSGAGTHMLRFEFHPLRKLKP